MRKQPSPAALKYSSSTSVPEHLMQRLRVATILFTRAQASLAGALVCAAALGGCVDAGDPLGPGSDPIGATQPARPGTDPVTGRPGGGTPRGQLHVGTIAGFVIDESDECIMGARVELVDGPQAGAVFVQTVCGFWDYGHDLGYSFHGLPTGAPLTVRATAEGYRSAETRAAPTSPYSYTTMIVLTRDQ